MVHILMKFREGILNVFQIPRQEQPHQKMFFFHFKRPQLLKLCNRESKFLRTASSVLAFLMRRCLDGTMLHPVN